MERPAKKLLNPRRSPLNFGQAVIRPALRVEHLIYANRYVRCLIVLRDALAIGVHDAKIDLRFCVSLLSRETIPAHRLCMILQNAFSNTASCGGSRLHIINYLNELFEIAALEGAADAKIVDVSKRALIQAARVEFAAFSQMIYDQVDEFDLVGGQ